MNMSALGAQQGVVLLALAQQQVATAEPIDGLDLPRGVLHALLVHVDPPCSIARRASLFDFASPAWTTASTRDRPSPEGTRAVGISCASRSNALGSTFRGSRSLKRIAFTAVALEAACFPWTMLVTSTANLPWASRRLGSFLCVFICASMSGRGSSVKSLRYDSTSRSSTLYQNW